MGFDLGEVIGKPILDALPALRGTELPKSIWTALSAR
jgi:hypothetical protein